MRKSAVTVCMGLLALIGGPAWGSVANDSVSVNGVAAPGPLFVGPSATLDATISLDLTNDGSPTINAWRSTQWGFFPGGSSGCSAEPPDAVPGAGQTIPGVTANLAGLTAPATPGNYQLLFTAFEADGCTGTQLVGLQTMPIVVVPPTQAIPTLSQWALIALAGLLGGAGLIALRRS